jgi:hypothetical protein
MTHKLTRRLSHNDQQYCGARSDFAGGKQVAGFATYIGEFNKKR